MEPRDIDSIDLSKDPEIVRAHAAAASFEARDVICCEFRLADDAVHHLGDLGLLKARRLAVLTQIMRDV